MLVLVDERRHQRQLVRHVQCRRVAAPFDLDAAFTSLSALDRAVGAQFIAFAIAFAVIASYWLMSHRMLASFHAIDTRTIVLHLWLLAAIVLLPFTTEAVGDPDVADLPLPTVLMAVSIAAVSALHTLVWVVGSRSGLLDHAPTEVEWRTTVAGGIAPAVVFLASVPIAYVISPGAARLSWLLLVVVNPVVGAWMTRRR